MKIHWTFGLSLLLLILCVQCGKCQVEDEDEDSEEDEAGELDGHSISEGFTNAENVMADVKADQGQCGNVLRFRDLCEDCDYIPVHPGKLHPSSYVTERPRTKLWKNLYKRAHRALYQHVYVQQELDEMEWKDPKCTDEVASLKRSCPTKEENILGFYYGYWIGCVVVKPWVQKVTRVACTSTECCGTGNKCMEDGYTIRQYIVYCQFLFAKVPGKFLYKYDYFPTCCSCKRCLCSD